MKTDPLALTHLSDQDLINEVKRCVSSERDATAALIASCAVWARDGGRCAFVGTNGRCGETGFLEFHHVVPFAAGGQATIQNIEVRCKVHNLYEAEQYLGPQLPLSERHVEYGAEQPTRSGPS